MLIAIIDANDCLINTTWFDLSIKDMIISKAQSTFTDF